MQALVQVQRMLVGTDATPDELMDRIPELALTIVKARGSVFELIDGDSACVRSGSAAAAEALGLHTPLQGSLSGEAIRLNRTMRCDDSETDPRVARKVCRKFGFRSVLATVVRDESGPIGILKMFGDAPAHFGSADADSLELLAEALGAVIQRKRADSAARRALAIQASIVRTQQHLASSHADVQTLMDLIVERAQELTGAQGSSIALIDGDHMVYRAGFGMAVGRLGVRIKLKGSLGGLSIDRAEVLQCDDTEIDPRVNRQACREFGVRSLISAPLLAGGLAVGTLRVMSGRPHAFGQFDVSNLQMLAESMGIAMHRHSVAQQLQSSELQYRLLFSAHPLPMWVYDAESLRFLAINDAAIAQYGYSRAEFLSMSIRDIRPAEAMRALDSSLAKLTNLAQSAGVWEHLRKDGSIIEVEVSVNTVVFEGRTARFALVNDVTERNRAELRLRKSKWLLNIAGRAAQVGGWSMDHRGQVFSWSDELSAIHDLPPDTSCTTEEALDFYAPESRAPMRQAVFNLSRHGIAYDLELEIITAKGRRIFVRTMGEAVRDSAGAIVGAQGAVQDISERKRDEEKVRALAARLTTTLESITDAFYTLDPEWRFTYVNSETERLMRHARADLLGRVIWDEFPEAIGTNFDIEYRRAIDQNCSVVFESYFAPWDQWFEVHAYPSDAGLAVYFRDVSERHRAQEALRSLNENLEAKVMHRTVELERTNSALASKEEEIRSVVEHMADGVITFNDDGIIRSANSKIEAIFGQQPSALVARNISVIIPALGELMATRGTQSLRETEDVIRRLGREADGRHLSGDRIFLDVAISDYQIQGKRLWTAILRDIGEQVRIMADLQQARLGAEEASRAKSAFVAAMSHEIRTPMNGVIGMIEVLSQTGLAADQERLVNVARESAQALLAIIEDILDFSKIEAGKVELERAPLSVARIVGKACELVSGMARDQGVALVTEAYRELPAAVWGDAGRLRQVLVNLLSNAIKFSKGRIAAMVLVRVRASERTHDRVTVELEVEDNGIGMDQATVAGLFVPFSQADASTKRRFGGTGLGLTISHHLVGLMGGQIDVRSIPNGGSVFTVSLPFALAPGDLLANDADRFITPSGHAALALIDEDAHANVASKVLVAEDNLINQQVIAEQLNRLGYPAEIVENGRDALDLWRCGGFGVLLTDLQMPEMDGYELTAAIRIEECGRARIPIVALTANALKDEANRCKAAGMDDYLTKPVQMATLDRMLKRWLKQGESSGTSSIQTPEQLPPAVDNTQDRSHAANEVVKSPVDPTILPSLIGGDATMLNDFMKKFLTNATQAATDMAAAFATGDGPRAGAVAHRLKSSARACGASHLSDLCGLIEAGSDRGHPGALSSVMTPFTAELARIEEWAELEGWKTYPPDSR